MEWQVHKLGDLCTIEKGNIGITKAIAGEYPLVVLGEERKTHNEYQFEDDAVIIPLVSSTGHGHKSMKRIHFQSGKFALGSILCAVTPKDKNIVSAQYLFRYLDLNKENELVARMRGMANVSLPMSAIADIDIPLPALKEQIDIVERFGKMEKLNGIILGELSNHLTYLRNLRQQILQDAIQGKLVPQNPDDEPAGKLLERIKSEKELLVKQKKIKKEQPLPPIKPEDIPFEIPEGWVWCRLGDTCSKIGSGSTPKGSNYSMTGIPFFRSQNVHDKGLNFEDIKFINSVTHSQMEGTVVQPLDLLLNITGGSIGRCAIVPIKFSEGNVSQHVCIIRGLILFQPYLHLVVLSPYFQKLIFGSTTGAGREGLPKYNLEQFTFPLPPLIEQHRIVQKIGHLMQTCDELENTIQQNQNYTQELLQVALKEALTPNQ